MSNCSLLDEATAGAETAFLLFNERSKAKVKLGARKLFVDKDVFASTRDVILTRCIPQGIEVVLGKWNEFDFADEFFGAIVQYPGSLGGVNDYSEFVAKAHDADIKVGVAADLLGLVLLTPPGEWGADVVFGSAQRFGVPMYFGGPSAGYIACRMEYKRTLQVVSSV